MIVLQNIWSRCLSLRKVCVLSSLFSSFPLSLPFLTPLSHSLSSSQSFLSLSLFHFSLSSYFLSHFQRYGSTNTEKYPLKYTVHSHTFILFWLTKTSMSVETHQLSFHVLFLCLSSKDLHFFFFFFFSIKSFLFLFLFLHCPYSGTFPFHVVSLVFIHKDGYIQNGRLVQTKERLLREYSLEVKCCSHYLLNSHLRMLQTIDSGVSVRFPHADPCTSVQLTAPL